MQRSYLLEGEIAEDSGLSTGERRVLGHIISGTFFVYYTEFACQNLFEEV